MTLWNGKHGNIRDVPVWQPKSLFNCLASVTSSHHYALMAFVLLGWGIYTLFAMHDRCTVRLCGKKQQLSGLTVNLALQKCLKELVYFLIVCF